MNGSSVDISLVSFSSIHAQESLLKQLDRKGFDNITHINNNKWLNNISPKSIGLLLLQIDNLAKWREPILDTLKSMSNLSNHITTLAIFTNPDISSDEQILKHCDEFITYPCHESELSIRINKLSLPPKISYDENLLIEKFLPFNLIGQSKFFLELLKTTYKISQCDAPVLIEGKTGTGKELFAHAIHYLSQRKNAAFIPINCGSLPDQLFDNELFGHEKGAFTDAKTKHHGLIKKAECGTLFLDEIEVLSEKAQISLLRFLQDFSYRPLGSSRTYTANIRLIAASNQSLKELVEKGKFREDLYYRLNIMLLKIPELKDRENDLELLTNYFLKKNQEKYNQEKKELHPAMLCWMKKHTWPGNIRELENLLHRAFLLSDSHWISDPTLNDIIENDTNNIQYITTANTTFKDGKEMAIKEFEVSYLTHLMDNNSGNVSQAARQAGKERRALGKLLKKHRLR